jgi:hypothetical protein
LNNKEYHIICHCLKKSPIILLLINIDSFSGYLIKDVIDKKVEKVCLFDETL